MFTGKSDVIFSGTKFSSALRNTRKSFRELYGTVFGPETFSGLLRNARQSSRFPTAGQGERSSGNEIVLTDKTRQDKTRQDLFYSAQFYRTFRLKLHRQLSTVQLRNKGKKKNVTIN